jgi:hypothetical protein
VVKLGSTLGWMTLLVAIGCGGGGRGGDADPGDDMNMPVDDAGVVPGVEVCNGSDDNGNDLVDEACGCGAGETQACFPGPVDQNALERCKLGVQMCDPNLSEFGGWSSCDGYVECDVLEKEFVYGEEENVRPVDIVMVIDQSGSMSDEIASVKTNVNMLTTTLVNSGIDFRFTMVAQKSTSAADTDKYRICVPTPLASADCGDNTRFKHISDINCATYGCQGVDSWDALTTLEARISDIESFMREDSLRVFIVVSDDNPSDGYQDEVDGQEFHDFISVRPGFEDYVFHSVVGDSTCPTSGGNSIANVGTDFLFLSMQTSGIVAPICSANWSQTFQDFATNILSRTLLYSLSDDPENPLDNLPYDVVALDFVDPASGTRIPQPRGTVWDYNPDNNSVTLFDGFTPSNGTKMIVKYRMAKE